MWLSALLGASWPELVDRLEGRGALARWQEAEPALLTAERLDDLPILTALGAEPVRSDAVIGALVRLAATDNGDDTDAAVVLLHLLRPGLSVLRGRLLSAGVLDADALVVGQAMIQLRSFPWMRRTRAHAANIVRDTGKALAREFAPAWGREVPVDPLCYEFGTPGEVFSGIEPDERDLAQLLAWAQQNGVVDAQALQVLLDYVAHRCLGGSAHARVAAVHGMSVRTCKRRCATTLAALRSAAPDFLAA
jgi:hypothetical protein